MNDIKEILTFKSHKPSIWGRLLPPYRQYFTSGFLASAFNWFDEKIYWPLKYRFALRYHIVKLKVPPSWMDADHRMFHAMFAVLGGYVEDDLGKATIEHEPEHTYRGYRLDSGDIDKQAIDLWLWYLYDLPNSSNFGISVEEKRLEAVSENKEADEKLEELFKIRKHLWV